MPDPCRCGAGSHPTDPERCERGHMVVGNQTARTHGVRAFESRGADALPRVVRDTADSFREQIILDRGGADTMSAIEGAYCRRLAELEAVVRLLAADLAQRGLTTPKGRVRGTFTRWLEALDRWDKYATRLGIERKPRQVPTLREYLDARAMREDPETVSAERSEPS